MGTRVRKGLAAVALAGLLAVGALLASPGSARAEIDVAGWKFTDLTFRDVPIAFDLAFDSQRVAWAKLSDSGGLFDLFILDLATGVETRVTDSPEVEYGIALDGSHLAWVSGQEGDTESDVLRLRDLATGATTIIARGMIMWDDRVQIAGDHVAWTQFGRAPGSAASKRGLYLHTISSSTTVRVSDLPSNVSSGSGGNQVFDLSETHVAFIKDGQDSASPELWLYDIQAATAGKLGVITEGLEHVSLEAGLVTWAAPAGSGPASFYAPSDIFLHHISAGATEKIVTIKTPEPYPKTDGRFVVGDDYPGDSTQSTRVIWAYDANTGRHIDVSANKFLNFTPEISGGLVVWERGGELESEIMAHDLLSGQTTQLSCNRTWMDQLALVNDRTVVWWKHWCSMETGVPEPRDRFMVAGAPSSFVDPFADVAGQHRFRTAILGMAELGIAAGYPLPGITGGQVPDGRDRVFRPEEPLLRAQLAKMICEAFDLPVTETMTSAFADLGPDDPANLYPHEYVAALTAAGAIKGKTASRFDPYAPVTRAQAVTMLVRALDTFQPGLLKNISGQAPGAYYWEPPHLDNLRKAYANDLLSSIVDWLQRWDARTASSRGEAAQMLWNALELMD
ncbi:MAG: S-layer homology domain-containing protein [Thermoleophilia bacterium]|nr:S-layer homology domain-containing protein [Thermoleophilia bacterium]